MKYLRQVKIERTEDIYEDTETANVYKIITERSYDSGIGIIAPDSEIYIEIYQDSMMHPNNLYIEKDPRQIELLLKKILGSEK
tara:strand:+ start:340 stop:588 length:249 start_codon:yes stop_codon:yes gene_type:complete